jgi:stress response protein YsnF
VSSTDDESKTITVATDKDAAKDGPAFDDDKEITPEFEDEVYSYYGLERAQTTEDRGSYGSYYSDEGTEDDTVGPGMTMGDTEHGHFEEHGSGQKGVGRDDDKSDLEDEDELRVQRSEEELVAGTREREAGQLKVRKRVRTDHERIEVPPATRRSPSSASPSRARPPNPRSARRRSLCPSPRKRSWWASGRSSRKRSASARTLWRTPRSSRKT